MTQWGIFFACLISVVVVGILMLAMAWLFIHYMRHRTTQFIDAIKTIQSDQYRFNTERNDHDRDCYASIIGKLGEATDALTSSTIATRLAMEVVDRIKAQELAKADDSDEQVNGGSQ